MFKPKSLHWLGAFKYLNIFGGKMSLPWLVRLVHCHDLMKLEYVTHRDRHSHSLYD